MGKYLNVLKAGILGGIAIVAVYVAIPRISLIILDVFSPQAKGYLGNDVSFEGALLLAGLVGFVLIGIMLALQSALLIVTGALAAKFNAAIVGARSELILLGGMAGLMAEAISYSLLWGGQALIALATEAMGGAKTSGPFIMDAMCCLPVFLSMGIALGSIGPFAYSVMVPIVGALSRLFTKPC